MRVGPSSRQEVCDILTVAMIIRQFTQYILHPSRGSTPAALQVLIQRVYDCSAICRRIITAEEVVLTSQRQRSDGILDEIVVDVYTSIIYISRQTRQEAVCIDNKLHRVCS